MWLCIICKYEFTADDAWHVHPTLRRGICLRCANRELGRTERLSSTNDRTVRAVAEGA